MTRPRGFTLIEAIAVIAITGIIATVVAVFVARPVQGYADTVRRALLADAADTALRRMSRDIRTAVPNSVRLAGSTKLEFVPTNDGGRYRVEQAAAGDDILDFTTTDNSFQTFGVTAADASTGDYLVIFNTGQTKTSACNGADVYEGCNRRTITAVSAAGLSFTVTANPLPFDSPAHRFQVVPNSGPVTYVCEGTLGTSSAGNGTATLRRYTGYATGGGAWAGVTPDGTGALLADNVSACAFTYTSSGAGSVTTRDGLVTLALTLTRANESVSLYHEVHVDNQP